jgi:hypothetical protein
MELVPISGHLHQSQSYVTTDGQLASLSWCQALIWDLRPDFFLCLTIAGLLVWGALSDERKGLSFIIYNVQYIYILHVITLSLTPAPTQDKAHKPSTA